MKVLKALSLLLLALSPFAWASAQESLPAELYQLLEDAKWLKDQGKLDEARAKLEEYDRQVAGWRAAQERLREVGGEEWLTEAVKWSLEVDIIEGLDVVEREFTDGQAARAELRLKLLRDRITSGISLGRAQCLYGRIVAARSEVLADHALELGGPCKLGATMWGSGSALAPQRASVPASSEKTPLVLVSVDGKMTESNDSWQRWAWQVTMRNSGEKAESFVLEVQWLDQEGFMVDNDLEYGLSLQPGEERTFNGYSLVSQPGATRVSSVEAIVGVPRDG